ncbi:MAG: polysaccharide biosynthesis tyrosine autokinase [Geobacteraceae bacterium]|nr:polysaccharide biosynthesis tyrosine autokinase [Geobacteraceae bacterium]
MSRIEQAMEKARELASASQMVNLNQKPFVCADVSGQIDVDNRRLIALNDYNLPITEEYRKLKSIIIQITSKEPLKNLLLVTSSIGGEGKSLTALNLAISLAQEHDKRVLLVDADLRKPSICRYLGLEPTAGLTECLKDGVSLEKLLLRTDLGNLTVLPAGTPQFNPVELFSSQKMKDLLALIKEQFSGGYVVIDSSPVLPFAEARILSNLVDGVVYVVKESGASYKNIQEGLNNLFEANVIGLVFNKATTASLAGGYHYYYYDYDYNRRDPDQKTQSENKKSGFLSMFSKRKVV